MERYRHFAGIAVLVWFTALAAYSTLGSVTAVLDNHCLPGFTGCTEGK